MIPTIWPPSRVRTTGKAWWVVCSISIISCSEVVISMVFTTGDLQQGTTPAL